MQLVKRNSICFLILLVLMGCMAHLTPQQQTLWAVNVYNAQYDLYLDQVIDPTIVEADRAMLKANPTLITEDMINKDLSDDQRVMLREKKKVLIELFPIIDTIKQLQENGLKLDAATQNRLTELINRLIALTED